MSRGRDEQPDIPVEDQPTIRVKGRDGTWRELEAADRPMSDDPEVNQLWELPIEELDAIVADENHPLHEKAVAVSAQVFAPLGSALSEWAKTNVSFDTSMMKALSSHLPNIDRSWISDAVLEFPQWRAFRESLPERQPDQPLVIHSIDFDSETPPAATVAQVRSAVDDMAIGIFEELLAVQREQLAQAKLDAAEDDKARDIARSAKAAAWWAAWAAIAAVLASVGGIVTTVLLSD